MIKIKFFLCLYLLLLINQLTNSKIVNKADDYLSGEINIYNIKNTNKFLGKLINNKKAFNNNENTSDNSEGWLNLKNLSIFSYFHLILSFLVMPILCIVLILKDMYDDKIIKSKMSLSSNEKVRTEYGSFKNTFIISAKYLFSWFLFKYHYPLTNILIVYNYNHPRFIRLIIYIISILFNTLLATLLYIALHSPLQANDDFNLEISLILETLIISIIVCIIIETIIHYTTKYIFEFEKKRREIFKSKFEILRRYIYYFVKKDILFNSKWHLIRNRMITYYRLCGSLLLSQVKKNKYQRYVRNKTQNTNEFYIYPNIISNTSSFSSIDKNVSKSQILGKENLLIEKDDTDDYKDANINKKSFKSTSKIDEQKQKKGMKYDDKRKDDEKESFLRVTKNVNSFSFSKFGINNMKLKTVKKIEDIKNRYISKKNDIKFDETMEIDKNIKIFENLDIESLEGFTYISTDAMIDKLNSIKSNSKKLIISILTSIVSIIILLLVNFELIILQMGSIFQNKNNQIEGVLPTIFIEIIIINFIKHRAICLFIAYSISNFYGKKKRNCCYKLIFDIFYEKYIRYLYRIRLLITKYQREFNFIEK